MIKLSSIDYRKSEYIVTSYTKTPPGFWQMNGHFSRLPVACSPTDLGSALLDALDASNTIQLRDVDASTDAFAPVLIALGLKNYAQYLKGTKSVSIEVGNDDVLRVTPMRNGGAREGLVELTEETRVVDDVSPQSVGAAIASAMRQSLR